MKVCLQPSNFGCPHQLVVKAKDLDELEDLFVETIRAKPSTITTEEVRKAFDNAMRRF